MCTERDGAADGQPASLRLPRCEIILEPGRAETDTIVHAQEACGGDSTSSTGGQRVAMRQGSILSWLQGDHLGATSLGTDVYHNIEDSERYQPYGWALSHP